jgi:hypothetical protein
MIVALVGYFMGYIDEYLSILIGVILILLSIKRFLFSFKRIVSKNATLILVVELLLDFVFAGLLIYLQDHVELFVGLIIYTRGVSYLLINYIATRKIKLAQYILNILFVTFGSFLMFYPIDSLTVLVLGVSVIFLLFGAIYLQAGIVKQVEIEKAEEEIKKNEKAQLKTEKKQEKTEEELEKLEKKVTKVVEKNQKKIEEADKLKKEIERSKKFLADEMVVKKPEPKTEVKKPEPKVEDKKPEPKPDVKKSEPKVEEKKEEPKVSEVINYNAMTLVQLKAMAKDRNMSGYSQLNKAELITKLKEHK